MRLNKTLLTKAEEMLKALDYKIRYEKGNFRSGSCVVWNKKMIVISKFYSVEEKIKAIIEVLNNKQLDTSSLSPDQQAILVKANQSSLFN